MNTYHDRPLPRSAVEGRAWQQETLEAELKGYDLARRVGRMERERDRYKLALERIAMNIYGTEQNLKFAREALGQGKA